MSQVYINKTATFYPNTAIANNEMEQYLGHIHGRPSKSKHIVLRNNGIEQRYYALNTQGEPTHTNAEITVQAIRNLFPNNTDFLTSLEFLSCGTTTPDQLLPSHAVMVHGLLPETSHIEVVCQSGSCCSGMHALKFAYLAIKSGEIQKAVSTGSERISKLLQSNTFEEEAQKLEELNQNPYVAFEKDFLRWMLSDGAGAFYLENKPNEHGISLRVEWIELFSYAHQQESCMYMGCEKMPDGTLKGYHEYSSKEIVEQSILSLKQDTKLLSLQIIELGFSGLKDILAKHAVSVDSISYLLPHMSSYFFQSKIYDILQKNDIGIPYEKWFTNLKHKGNMGAGSIYTMLHDLIETKPLKIGDTILLAVPESARFSYAFCLLTVC